MGTQVNNPVKEGSTRSFTNILLYILCITSLGFSVYNNVRQSDLEDRTRHIRYLDDRITIMETKMENFNLQYSQAGKGYTLSNEQPAPPDIENIIRKMSLEVAGIGRLRRDVSTLQISRQERQASIQQSPDCICQPGIYF